VRTRGKFLFNVAYFQDLSRGMDANTKKIKHCFFTRLGIVMAGLWYF
jgi:hypothetical protein